MDNKFISNLKIGVVGAIRLSLDPNLKLEIFIKFSKQGNLNNAISKLFDIGKTQNMHLYLDI